MRKLVLAAVLATGLSGPTKAASECHYAVESYNSALDSISLALKRYANCV